MNSMKRKGIVLALLMVIPLAGAAQGEVFFRTIGGIPHLPVFSDTNQVPSSAAGALVYVSTLFKPMVYSGTGWDDLCTSNAPAGNAGYFKIEGGIPIIPVHGAVGAAASGSVYYSSDSNTIKVSDGATWADINSVSGLSDDPGFSSGSNLVKIPVLSSAPAGEQGAVYFNSGDNQLHYYTGSQWLPQRCGPPFITKWNMVTGDFTLPIGDGTYNCTIDWGDGTEPNAYVAIDPADFTHNYASDINDCNITISGTFPHLQINNNAAVKDKLTEVVQWGDVGFTSFYLAFRGCSNLTDLPAGPITGVDGVTTFGYAFQGCTSLTEIPANLFDPNYVPDTVSSFQNCFNACKGLDGTVAPKLWESHSSTGTKSGCYKLGVGKAFSNDANIPTTWGGSLPP